MNDVAITPWCQGSSVETVGFKMKLLPGNVAEYRRRHDEIWPELVAALKNAGISRYSIFLDPDDDTLFAVLDQQDADRVQALAELPVMRRWWDAMAPLMQTRADNEPVTVPLQRVFYLD